MTARQVRYTRDTDEFGRGITFLDALFAFALTLLVTTLDVPPAAAFADLASLRAALGVPLAAFALSFAVTATFWRAHHGLMLSFRAIDPRLITINLVLAASIVLLPFSTEVLAVGQQDGRPLPVALYGLDVGVAALALNLTAWHGLRADLLTAGTDRPRFRRQAVVGLARPAVFAVSIVLAFTAGPGAAQLSWLALVPVGAVTARVERPPAAARG